MSKTFQIFAIAQYIQNDKTFEKWVYMYLNKEHKSKLIGRDMKMRCCCCSCVVVIVITL
jgi:hypothetical protein